MLYLPVLLRGPLSQYFICFQMQRDEELLIANHQWNFSYNKIHTFTCLKFPFERKMNVLQKYSSCFWIFLFPIELLAVRRKVNGQYVCVCTEPFFYFKYILLFLVSASPTVSILLLFFVPATHTHKYIQKKAKAKTKTKKGQKNLKQAINNKYTLSLNWKKFVHKVLSAEHFFPFV